MSETNILISTYHLCDTTDTISPPVDQEYQGVDSQLQKLNWHINDLGWATERKVLNSDYTWSDKEQSVWVDVICHRN